LLTSNYQASRSRCNLIQLRHEKRKTNTWVWHKETMNTNLHISSKTPDCNVEVNDRTVLFIRKFNPFIAEVLLAKIPSFSHLCIVFTVTSHSHVQLRNVTNKLARKASDVRICRYLYCEISHLEVNGANERQIAHVLVKMFTRRL
jgi:hypothetical protein